MRRPLTGYIPSDPFITWFFTLRRNKLLDFQRTYDDKPAVGGGGRGSTSFGSTIGGSSPRKHGMRGAMESQFDAQRFCLWINTPYPTYQALIQTYKLGRPTIRFGTVDTILTAVGRNDLLNEWYPLDMFDDAGRWKEPVGPSSPRSIEGRIKGYHGLMRITGEGRASKRQGGGRVYLPQAA